METRYSIWFTDSDGPNPGLEFYCTLHDNLRALKTFNKTSSPRGRKEMANISYG